MQVQNLYMKKHSNSVGRVVTSSSPVTFPVWEILYIVDTLTYLITCYFLTYLCTYLLSYLFSYSMEQSPSWEANQFSATQETPRILWNLKVYYHSNKDPPPVPILNLLDPVHTLTSHFLKIHLNIILPSISCSPRWYCWHTICLIKISPLTLLLKMFWLY